MAASGGAATWPEQGACAIQSTPKIRILIVEDDPNFRDRFVDIVKSCADFELQAAVGTCELARRWLAQTQPDVLLCDLGLPDGDGAEVVRLSRRLYPALDAMVVTVFGDEAHVMRSLEAGATGYLLKDSLPEDVIATIKLLREGGSPINPIIARRLLQRFSSAPAQQQEEPQPAQKLSEREREVLQLVAKGYRTPEIGGILNISHHTVYSHIKNIYGKLEVTSRGEAVYEASRLKLI